MQSAVDSSVATVHWAYLVGGSPDVYRDMRRHLLKAGVNVAGYSEMGGRGKDVKIPRNATVVLLATDGSYHAATDRAAKEAHKRGIKCIPVPFRHWSLCSLRLTEAGILGRSIFQGVGGDLGVRKFQAILESTPTVGIALLRREVVSPSSETGEAFREEFLRDNPDLVPHLVPPTSQTPPPVAAPPPPTALALPRQDITPTFSGSDLLRKMVRTPSQAARRRQDLARKIIQEAKGEIANCEVKRRVQAVTGMGVHNDLINHIRVELGFKPMGRGGREVAALTPGALARLHIAPEPGSPPQNPGPEAPKPPPEAPAVAPRKPAHRPTKHDPLDLIAQLQEELRARGIWGVMIEASGTFTFQQGK